MAEHGDQRQGGVTGEPGSGFADTAISPPVDDPGRDELLRLLSLSTARTPENYQTLARLSASLSTSWAAGRKWTESDTAEVRALLAEYTSLRQESMNTINNRIQILILGVAAILALTGASVTSERLSANRLLVAGVFSGAIPLVCVFVFLVWLSEAIRSHRVGYYLASAVEARINAKLERLVVTWEAALWSGVVKRDELWGPSMMALALVGMFGAAAPWFGVLLTGTRVTLQGPPLWEVWVPYGFFLMAGVYGCIHLPRLKNIPIVSSTMHTGDGPRAGATANASTV